MIRPETLFSEQGDTLSRPLEHLKACHRRIEERLDTLERIAAHEPHATLRQLAAAQDSGAAFQGLIARLVAHYRKHIAK